MKIYERIKNRRKELELTADQVADALGVSRATVYRYESAQIEKVPTDVLGPLSKVLRCTPAYLMGWDDDVESTSESSELPYSISDRAMQIALSYDQADERTRTAVEVALGIDFEKDRAVERSCG